MSKIVSEYLRRKRLDKNKMYLFRNGNFYIFIGENADKINDYIYAFLDSIVYYINKQKISNLTH